MIYFRMVSASLLVAAFWAHKWLSPEWGWESSLLEWTQVCILAIGLVLSWTVFSSYKIINNQIRYFGLFTTPCWLLLIGRELSWGRVFYPIGIEAAKGPYFPALKELWFGPYVYPLNTIIISVWLFAIVKYKLYMIPIRMVRQGVFPWLNFLLTLFSSAVVYVAEKQLHLPITEEIAETIVYAGLIVLTLQVKYALIKINYLKDIYASNYLRI